MTPIHNKVSNRSTRGCTRVSPDRKMPSTWKHEEHTQSITLCYTIIVSFIFISRTAESQNWNTKKPNSFTADEEENKHLFSKNYRELLPDHHRNQPSHQLDLKWHIHNFSLTLTKLFLE